MFYECNYEYLRLVLNSILVTVLGTPVIYIYVICLVILTLVEAVVNQWIVPQYCNAEVAVSCPVQVASGRAFDVKQFVQVYSLW